VELAGKLPNLQPVGTPPPTNGNAPAGTASDGYAVVLNNGGANKLDVYLGRDMTYDATVDPGTGVVEATLTVALTNDLPDGELPDSVTGNYTGDAPATNRTLLSLYTPLDVVFATVAGTGSSAETVSFGVAIEAGWNVHTTTLTVPPGDTLTMTVQLTGSIAGAEYRLAVRPMPLVVPEHHRIEVRTTDGSELVGFDGIIDRSRIFSPNPSFRD